MTSLGDVWTPDEDEVPAVVRILATCSRSFKDWSGAREILTHAHLLAPQAVLLHGACENGDQQIAGIWRSVGGLVWPMPAGWSSCAPVDERAEVLYREHGIAPCKPKHRKVSRRHGEYCPTAGLRRDVAMVETGPARCLAFLDPKSRTRGAVRTAEMAESAGIPTVRYSGGES